MKSRYLISFAIVVYLTSCSADEDTPKVDPIFLTVSVKSTFPDAGRVWAFVTDSQGDVISSQRLSVGINKFLGAAPDVINVTLLQYSLGSQNHYRFTTHPDIIPNSVINLDQANGLNWYVTYEHSLSAQISVTNYETPFNATPQLSITDGYAGLYTQTTPPALTLPLHNTTVDVLVSGFRGDSSKPVYGIINDVRNGDVKSIDFKDFVPFPKTISLPHVNSLFAYLGGYKVDGTKKISYTMFSSLAEKTPLPENLSAKLGYLENFDLYETFVGGWDTSHQLGKNTIYRRTGTINPVIKLPDYNMTISNTALDDFHFAYTGDLNFQMHSWFYNQNDDYVYWDIYNDDNAIPVITSIPENITAEFPALSFSKLKHDFSIFYQCTDGYNYRNYFEDFQKGNYPFTNPDYYELRFHSN